MKVLACLFSSTNSIKLSSMRIFMESSIPSINLSIKWYENSPVGLFGLHKKIASEFFDVSKILSISHFQFLSGTCLILAPNFLDAISYSQNVGDGITTCFLTNVLTKL